MWCFLLTSLTSFLILSFSVSMMAFYAFFVFWSHPSLLEVLYQTFSNCAYFSKLSVPFSFHLYEIQFLSVGMEKAIIKDVKSLTIAISVIIHQNCKPTLILFNPLLLNFKAIFLDRKAIWFCFHCGFWLNWNLPSLSCWYKEVEEENHQQMMVVDCQSNHCP